MKGFFKKVPLVMMAFAMMMTSTALAAQKTEYDMEYFSDGVDTELYVDGELVTAADPRYSLLKDLGVGLTIDSGIAYVYAESTTYEKMSHELSTTIYESKDKSS
ncbi:hypothetical protein MUJ63_03730 [Lachnospiraceae bacterium NSJ-143]|nr:hypothetical protein [Lachnospiraceae bacterium NSJ-143]